MKIEDIKSQQIRDVLNNPTTTEGQRHHECLRVATYLVGEQFPDNHVIDLLSKCYPALAQRSQSEIPNMVKGAKTLGLKPSSEREYKPVDRHKFKVGSYLTPMHMLKSESGPVGVIPAGMENPTTQFLTSVFKEGEFINITNTAEQGEDGKWRITCRGCTKTREQWLEWFKSHEGFFDSPQGAWVRVNPMVEGGAADKDVTDYRHVLVEFDHIPKEQQYAALIQSGMPMSCIIDSGGQSIHGWVRVDAANKTEHAERTEKVYSLLSELKPCANKNPSRFSRLPGIKRDGHIQHLLGLNVGAPSWDDWQDRLEADELPEEITLDSLEKFDRKNDPNNVLGNRWLCRGGSLLIQSQAGIGKSTLAMQMAISWAIGGDLFGIKTAFPLKTAIIQAENDNGDMAEMFQDCVSGMELSEDERTLLRSNLRIFRDTVRTGQDFIRMARNIITKTKADIFFVDPLLAFVGDDVSEQKVMSDFFRNSFGPILQQTGVIAVWIHHVGKPKTKLDMDAMTPSDLAYAGLGSSEFANIFRETMTLLRLGKDKKFNLILSKRGKRAGLIDAQGNHVDMLGIEHSKTGLHWIRSNVIEKTKFICAKKEKKSPPPAETGEGEIPF